MAIAMSRTHPNLATAFVGVLLVFAVFTAFGIGAVPIQPLIAIDVLLQLAHLPDLAVEASFVEKSILVNVRLPRVIVGLMAGSSMAVTGVLMQAFFRNPLADPALIGVATGGALGAVCMIVFGSLLLGGFNPLQSAFALPGAAFLGSLLTCILIFGLARQGGMVNVTTMLLCGIAVNAIAGAGIGFMSFLADDAQLRDITFWSLGSLGAANWTHVNAMFPCAVVLLGASHFFATALNAMLLGDADAAHLGFNVEKLKVVLLFLTCLGAGAVVATCGVIGFVGLIAPHASRLLVGPNHKHVVILSALIGALLLICADIAARTLVSPAELPIGVLTALFGGPLFLWLLKRSSRGGLLAEN